MAGWRWAEPIKHNIDSTYSKGEVAVLVPTDPTVTDGWTSADVDNTGAIQKGIEGTWVALRNVPRVNLGTPEAPIYQYHVPRWPLPVPDDPDSEDNYWWPWFYPALKGDCINGQTVQVYYNAGDKPT
jgi:hypothetical protein